jgi:hypothetical protein
MYFLDDDDDRWGHLGCYNGGNGKYTLDDEDTKGSRNHHKEDMFVPSINYDFRFSREKLYEIKRGIVENS